MKKPRKIILVVAAAMMATGCTRVFESPEQKLFRQYNAVINTFCDKVDAARTQAEYKKAMEWMAENVQPMARKIQRLSQTDPGAFARVASDPELLAEMQEANARLARTMMATSRLPGGKNIARLKGLIPTPPPRQKAASTDVLYYAISAALGLGLLITVISVWRVRSRRRATLRQRQQERKDRDF